MRHSIPKAFGLVLRRFREKKQWSQMELAEKADLHLNTIGMFERGERSPSLDTIFRLAKILDAPAEEMIFLVSKELSRR